MMLILDHIMEGTDLSDVHAVLAFLGALLTILVMQTTSYVNEDRHDPQWVSWGRRASYAFIALALLWAWSYSEMREWQPWPPELALIAGIATLMSIRLVGMILHIRKRRRRHKSARIRRH